MLIRRVWSLAALLLTLVLTGCPPAPEGRTDEQKNPFYLTGKERLQSLDYVGAIESFERALQENPKSALAHYELGVIYDQHQADYPAALYHYNKALKLRPSSYPADNIRQRIPACRQELIKADSLTVLNPSALRDIERLREENQQLRQQILSLQTALSATRTSTPDTDFSGSGFRPATSGPANPFRQSSPLSANPASQPTSNSISRSSTRGITSTTNSTRLRYHTVRSGETLAAISRKYNIRLETLLSANPGLDPRKMKEGQTIRVPAP